MFMLATLEYILNSTSKLFDVNTSTSEKLNIVGEKLYNLAYRFYFEVVIKNIKFLTLAYFPISLRRMFCIFSINFK